MSSDFTLHIDLTDEQKEEILAEYRESDLSPVEYFMQEVYIPRAIEAYRGESE